MDGERDRRKISRAYQDHRPYLVDLAFRMTGDIGAAEDIVQDAFSRLIRADLGEIEDERGWLIVVTAKFIAACATGDLAGLLAVLAPDAWGDVDLGPGTGRRPAPVVGAEHVARNLLHYWGRGATLVFHPVGGQPAVLGFTGRELTGVLVFTMRGEVIQGVHVIGDPRKLGYLSSQLSASA